MKYLKKFNEEIGNTNNPELEFTNKYFDRDYPQTFNRIEEFIKMVDKIINYDESELEEGDEPSNSDIISELGDLCNELTFTSEELQQVINSGRISDLNKFLQIILDETLRDEESMGNVTQTNESSEDNKISSSYQAFLFGCFLSNPNDFKIDDEGNLVDEGNIFTSDFNKWWEEGGKVPKQYQ